MIPDAFWKIADEVCTDKEKEMLILRARGLGWKRMGRELGISTEAVRGRYERAERKILKAIKEAA